MDVNAAAKSALSQLDKNSDGNLDKDELSTAPGLLLVLGQYDKDGSKSLSESELAEGIASWAKGKLGMRQVAFEVRLNGRPLNGAEIKLVPEPCFADALPTCTGTADGFGRGALTAPAESLPEHIRHLQVMPPGLYRVEITHPKRKVPEKYNVKTELGVEINLQTPGPAGIQWALSS